MKKSATVVTNDPKKKQIVLTMNGKVEKFANIVPARLRLDGRVDEELVKKITITTRDKYPFKILGTRVSKTNILKVAWEPVKGVKIPEYQLTVKNLRKKPGSYNDNIYVKVDSKVKPELRIRVYSTLRKPPEEKEVKNSDKQP